MASITVRGRGTANARPTQLSVALEVAATHDAAGDAFAEVGERSAELERLCDELGIAEAARSTTGVSVQELQEPEPDGRTTRRRYRASNRVTLRLQDPELVPGLLGAAVERAGVLVSGPWWQLAPDDPVHLDACRLAAADGRRRAEAYADELGARLGGLERVAEAGVGPPEPIPRATLAFSLNAPVHPGELEASATVEVTYALDES